MQNKKILPRSTFFLWGVLLIVSLLWLAVSWLVTNHILDSRVNALIQEKTAAIDLQAVNIAEGIASNLSDLHGIPTLVARDAEVLSALSRFGANAHLSPLIAEQRKKLWSENARLKALGGYLSLVGTSMGVDVVFIINAAGDCVASSNMDKPVSFVGENYAGREYFREAMDGKKGYQYAMGEASNIPDLFFSAPITLEGRIVGVVAAKINLSALSHLVNQADAFITDEYGVIILASDAKLGMRSLPGAAIAELSKAERMARYKRDDFPVLTVNPWPSRWGMSLHHFDEEKQPVVLTGRSSKEKETKIYVFRRFPEIVEFTQDRLRQFFLLGIFGVVVFLLIGVRIIFLRIRKQNEKQLRENQEQIHLLLNSVAEGIYGVDIQGNCTFVNAASLRILGYRDANEIIGKHIHGLIHHSHADGTPYPAKECRMYKSYQRNEKIHVDDEVFWRRDGSCFAVEYWSFPIVRDGQVAGAVATFFDITERKQAEDKLVKSERHSHAIAQSANDAIITGAGDGNIVSWNAAAERLFGYAEAEIIGRPMTVLMPEQFRNLHSEGLARVVAGGTPHLIGKTIELAGLRRDGSEFPLDLSLAQWQAADSQFFTAIIRDITERKLAEEALHQARRDAEAASLTKSEFLANMSHEIRTPMNAILGMAEILSETDLSPEQRRYVEIFQNAGNNLLELINDILDMSKVEAGQLELDKEDFSLEKALNELIDLHSLRALDKGLELALHIEHGVHEFAHGDTRRLKQCLTNLVGNAIKFSHKGAIVICVRPADNRSDDGRTANEHSGMLQFSVSDTGIGIPVEKRETIFEAFSQADSSTTRRFGGTGLGLTITRRLVSLMGGKIWVDSQEGQGSTFHFTAHLPQATQSVRADTPVDLRNLKVLVVDDFSINRTIVQKYLQPLGAEVSEAESAEQALALLKEAAAKEKPFALALVDFQMPNMNGLQLSIQIRAHPALKHLKIMMLSSDDTVQKLWRMEGLALSFLLKPIKRHELIQSIGRELQQDTPITPNGHGNCVTPDKGTRHARFPHPNPLPVGEGANESLRELHVDVETSPLASPESHGGLHILLAEDNPDNVLLIEVFLKQTAHRLDVAEDGLVALEKFRANRYDVVLMDVQMPKMGGYEATEEIRRIEAAEGRTPTMIIALTAHALKEDEQRSMDAGCNGHLTKPIKKKVLLEVLQSIR